MVATVAYLNADARLASFYPDPPPAWFSWSLGETIATAPTALDYPGFSDDLAVVRAEGQPLTRTISRLDESSVQVVVAPCPAPDGLGISLTFLELAETDPGQDVERLRSYLDGIPESLVILDQDGRIIHVNEKWIEFGCANGGDRNIRWEGVDYLGICQTVDGPEREDAAAVREGLRGVLSGELDYYQREYPCHSPAEKRWFLMEASPIRGNAIHGVAVSHLNITSRVKAEAKARLADVILDSSAEALVVTTPDERIIRVNPAFSAMTGFGAAEVIGKTPRILASGRHDAAFYRDLWRGLEETGFWRGELWNRRRSGEIFPQLATISVVKEPWTDEITHYVGLFTDISAIKANESRLQAINTELEQFAYVVSHDLRQPLRMITSYLQLLARRLGNELGPDARDFLAEATQGAKRMDRLIAELLDYALCGRQAAPGKVVCLDEIVKRTLRTLGPSLRECGATVTVVPPLPRVLAQETDIERVFENLIGNAIKYRAPDRPLTLTLSATQEGAVHIQDNGIGIAPEDEETVFAMFRRLHSGVARSEGTGLGLAICKKLIEHHGGTISVKANPDSHGCTFCLTLPLA